MQEVARWRVNIRGSTGAVEQSTYSEVWKSIVALPLPPVNAEKASDIHRKILPYVAAEFANDPLYAMTSTEVEMRAREIKRARRDKLGRSSTTKERRGLCEA